MENEKQNTFAEMQDEKQTEQPKAQENLVQPGEIAMNDFSDTAIGDSKKYVRPLLIGKEDVIDKFQVFSPDTTKEPSDSQSGNCKYWPVNMILTYESKNEDGLNNREYISGARCFLQNNGSASEISFWYEGAETQAAYLWEIVAKHLNVEPTNMSPRQFVAFLNSKPKVKIIGREAKNYKAAPGQPKTISKNFPEGFQ